MRETKPRGYWTAVFGQAVEIMNLKPDLDGTAAYHLARRLVDNQLAAGQVQLELTPLQPPETLILEPPKKV